jgi:RsiW-degrading membrane proteinase PrsW (M82 family)
MLVTMKLKFLRWGWLQILAFGIILFAVTQEALRSTHNPNFLPSVILLGAFIVPVTFVAYFYKFVRDRDISLPLLTTCFIVGGIVGTVAAGLVEYATLRGSSILTFFEVGLIEECVTLVFPIVMFVYWRYRHEADGLLFGIASGMGFAALETMGYSLVSFVRSGGNLGTLQQVLLIRGLLSPANHAAWTGIVCATLWRQRQKTGHWIGLPVIGAFILAVGLHMTYDMVNTLATTTLLQWVEYIIALLAIAAVGLGLIIWRFRKARNSLTEVSFTSG